MTDSISIEKMSTERYGLPEHSLTHSSRNHFDAIPAIHDIVKVETIKEEPIEIKWLIENGACDESRQEEVENVKFHEPISNNCEKNPFLTHSWKNTNFDIKGSEYIFAADIEQIKKEIKVENTSEDNFECTDDLMPINADLKTQTLKTEDGIDIVYGDIKPEIHEDKLSEKNSHPNAIANIVLHESSIDFGGEPQQNTTVEEDESDVERYIEKRFQCNFCSSTFSKSSGLKIHKRTHTGEKPYQCNMCLKSFTQKRDLKNHERIHTGEKPFQCNLCLKSFTQNGALTTHKRTHTGEKPFQCNMCLKSFTQNSDLKNHERTHTGEKPFQCNFCSMSFTRSSILKIHKRTHTGEKPYQCNMCLKSFTHNSDLKIHERTHTGEKPFQCNFCSKSFTRSSALKYHERTHTGEKPFQCNVCLKSFMQNGTMKTHKRTHSEEKL